MANIQILDSHVADLIAAGEVVERPASVAKELMENAIDAGANTVTVEISHGGMTFLRVTDDGCGIGADQLKTAFLRHATSKLRTQYDLEAIGTLGFRGEALAAIAAVSRIDVMTRTSDSPLGASLSIEGGIFGEVEEAGCPLGTTIVVRDLFYNTPARLKFMKKDAAEGAAVFSVVQRVALSHPEVSVKFIRDGKQEMLTPGDGQLQSATYAVLGRELALGFLPVKGSGEEMTVSGFVSLPTCCRGSRNYQFFFVNGRQVKSRLMMAALEEAYKNTKMVGKFPGCVLHLETKLNAVDVNVHPSKTEVKFGNERRVFDAVYHAVLSALTRDNTRPAVTVEKPKVHDTVTPNQTTFKTMTAEQFRSSGLTLNDSAKNKAETDWSPKPPVSTQKPPAVEKKPVMHYTAPPISPKPSVTIHTMPKPAPAEELKPSAQAPVLEKPTPAPVEEKNLSTKPEPTVEKLPEKPKESGEATTQIGAQQSGSDLERRSKEALCSFGQQAETEPSERCDDEIPWKIAGEVLNTYIIVEQGDTVLFIDKHAAHERMNFDRMKAQGYQPMVQTLLTPVTFRPAAEELEVLLENLSLLEEFGFGAEDFGGGALIVRQAPFDVDVGEIEATLLEIAGKLLTTGRADPSAARDELLHTMACKAAIKGGWKTSTQELEKVAQAVMSGQVKYCPHGRPVAIELTKKQLEKQFKRA